MKKTLKAIKKLSFIIVLNLCLSNVYAAPDILFSYEEKAGEQVALVHEIAKNYFYIRENLMLSGTATGLQDAIEKYKKNKKVLRSAVAYVDNYSFDITDLLDEEFFSYLKSPVYTDARIVEVLTASEGVAESYTDLIEEIRKKANNPLTTYSYMLERQIAAVEQMAKYYVVYSAGYREKAVLSSVKSSIKEFDKDLYYITSKAPNDPIVKHEVEMLNKWWKVMKKHFLTIERRQIPTITLVTTNKMLNSLNKIAEQLHSVKEFK